MTNTTTTPNLPAEGTLRYMEIPNPTFGTTALAVVRVGGWYYDYDTGTPEFAEVVIESIDQHVPYVEVGDDYHVTEERLVPLITVNL